MSSLPIEELTPQQIVDLLDQYIIGQQSAKKAVAIALRNRFRRLKLTPDQQRDIHPRNILMMGPTGVGKTEIARRLAQLAKAPFVKVEATKFTEVGYVGRDVESMVRDLAAESVRIIEHERMQNAMEAAQSLAREVILEQLSMRYPMIHGDPSKEDDFDYQLTPAQALEHRQTLVAKLESGAYDQEMIEVEFEESGSNFMQVFSQQGIEEVGLDMFGGQNPFGGSRITYRNMPMVQALPFLIEQEAKKLSDSGSVNHEAIIRAEQTGIIFIDEIDKVAIKSGSGGGPDVSREGVQRDLLPIIEGSTVATKYGPIKTDHILFITAGAFHMAKPSDLIPELQGRLAIRVVLDSLVENDLRRILSEPKNALIKQYQALLSVDGVSLSFTDDALTEIAHFASTFNAKTQNIGARRLQTILEKLLEEILFEAPYSSPKTIVFDAAKVKSKLVPLINEMTGQSNLI